MEKEYQPLLVIDFWRCFQVWKRNIVLISLVSALIFFVSILVTNGPTSNIYQAYSSVYTTASGGYDLEEAFRSNAALEEYSDVITSMKVLNHAAEMVDDESVTGESLSRSISVSSLEDSSVLKISVNHVHPGIAIAAANAVASSFVTEMSAITGQTNIHILDIAEDYTIVQNGLIQTWSIRLLATACAFAFLSLFFIIIDIFSTKVHTIAAASLNGELEVLGVIPELNQNEIKSKKWK